MTDDLIYRSGVAQAIEIAQRSLLTDNDALWENNRKYHKGLAWSRQIIDKAPAVDAVEVVRCKDCKWYKDFGTNYRLMDCSHEEGLEWVDENDFCSRGERRGDDA